MLQRLRGVCKCLGSHEVRYLVIGGIAAVLHGVPRNTFDLDILIEATPENAQRLLDAFAEAGLGTASLTSVDELLANEVTIFQDRVHIDVQTATPGLAFEEAWKRRQEIDYGGLMFPVVCREDLIASKLAAGRAIDLEDVRALRAGEAPPPPDNSPAQ